MRRVSSAGRVIELAAAAFAIIAVAAMYRLFYDNRLPSRGSFPVPLAELRRAAGPEGGGPDRIEIGELSHADAPRIAMVAGTDWRTVDLVRASYRLVWPDRSIVVDTANDLALARRFGAHTYDEAGWSRLLRAMYRADAIVLTHEHADHVGGLMAAPDFVRLLRKAKLTPE